jgi:hypothetical protein
MSLPGFDAETSLYKTRSLYRMSGNFGEADATIHPALSITNLLKSSLGLADLVSTTRDLGSLGYVDNPFPFAVPCGALGKDCCRAPAGSQNISAFGPLVSCQEGLGCDITTNKCVSPCGSPGQVCCDGPETRAPKWTPDGKIYSPNSWNMREMCNTGVCDKQTHRCITCGTQTGGPCCSSDAAQATTRCFRDAQTGNRLVCNDPWAGAGSHCVECGKGGQPKCLTAGEAPCDDGLVERESDGICVPCGWAGQPTCDRGEPCRGGHSVPDRWFSQCIPAGGPNQPCRPDGVNGGCDYQGLFCNDSRICQPCGHPGEICCPPGRLKDDFQRDIACQSPGECRDNRCFACGYDNMPVCLSGSPCRTLSEPIDGWCRPCGREGQSCCSSSTIIGRCLDGMHCDDGVCRRPSAPPPPPPPNQLKTCNGEDWSFSTIDREVFIKGDDQCVFSVFYPANSVQEAYICARRKYGGAVVTDPVYPYKYALTSAFGCNTVNFVATDDAGAQTCAQSQCINCIVTPGDCP